MHNSVKQRCVLAAHRPEPYLLAAAQAPNFHSDSDKITARKGNRCWGFFDQCEPIGGGPRAASANRKIQPAIYLR